ncbi:hypothetical protein JC525_18515 [Alteromonas sp. IB21]|uniref:hypothetical protein n=1 Tax=Alteromonas sp. IB21 TaxID=2779369 RepID=UPI0018E8EC53|nr:hypothetical protein [Alteromonas sp. IB21]MBJ2130925.1 hypothetical protein [Alteromonas sp. IB21]
MFKRQLLALSMLLLTTLSANAENDASVLAVTSAPSALISVEQSKSTVFNVTMPSKGAMVVTLYGGDLINLVEEDSPHISSKVDKNSAIILASSAGTYAVGVTTKCGLSMSIVINAVDVDSGKPANFELFKPKVAIDGSTCSAVTKG